MRVACPQCNAAYQIDDARIPDRGANVRCSRCQKLFPVKKAAAGEAGAVPLPGAAPGTGSIPLPGAAPGTGSIPLPGAAPGTASIPLPGAAPGTASIPLPAATPGTGSIPLPPPRGGSPAPAASGGGIPLPGPFAAEPPPPFASPFDAPAPPSAAAEADPSPFDAAAPGLPASPFGGAPDPFASADAPPATAGGGPFTGGDAGPFAGADAGPFGGGDAGPFAGADAGPFGGGDAGPFAADAGPFAPSAPFGDAAPAAPPALAPPPPPPAPSLSFGEVDLGGDPAAPGAELPAPFASSAPPPSDDPFDLTPQQAAPASGPAFPPPPVAPGSGAEELENLFGESPRPEGSAGSAASARGGYQVRRRSGKVFGPFSEAQIVEMLSKGELLGNEDVSTDGTTYTPIGAAPAFGAALRKAAAGEPAPRPAAPAVFGDRMAAAKIVEGSGRRPLPRWLKPVLLAAPVVLLVAVGVGAGFTRHGFFFTRDLFQRADPVALANLAGQARTALARGDFASQRAALDHAGRALRAAPRAPEAILLHTLAIATLELGHGAAPQAVAQARAAADALARDEKGTPEALAARLAMDLVAEPVAVTPAQEAALDAAAGKGKPDPEIVALLARSALARGDAAQAGAQARKLGTLEKGPRGPVLEAQAAALRGNAGEARAALARALERDPGLPAAHLELAALDEQAGELAKARERLEPLAASAAADRLAPAERARALAMLGSIVGRDPARDEEADKLLKDAVAADGRSVDTRVRLVLRRIQAGDAAGAVEACDVPEQNLVARPALAAACVRALALSGKMLDASLLADRALSANPGRVDLMVAKAVTLVAAGKPVEGKQLFEGALARDPEAVEPRVALARFALAESDLGRAEALLAAAVQKGPRDASALAATGDLQLARGDRVAAEASYRKALELDRAHAPAEVGLARLAQAKGDLAAARDALGRAVKYDPHNPEILVEHATLLWKAGELAPAQADLEAAVDVAPRHPLALTRLGAVLLQRGEAEPAVRRLTAASSEAPELVEARYWLGQALLARAETPAAIVQLRKAVQLARTAENLVALGGAYERSNALADALDSYKLAATVAPDALEPQEKMAQLLASNGRCDHALPVFERAIAIAPRVARLRVAQAQCTARLGKHEEAVRLLEALLRSDPKAPGASYLLARSLHESRGPGAALPYYERAAQEDPENPLPHYYLGYVYKERNQRARAIAEFRKFLERKPDAPERADLEAEIEDLGGN